VATIKLLIGALVGIVVCIAGWHVAVVRIFTYMFLFALCLIGMQVAKRYVFTWLRHKRERDDKILGWEPNENMVGWGIGAYNTFMVIVMACGEPLPVTMHLYPLYGGAFIVLSFLLVAETLCVMTLWPSGDWHLSQTTVAESGRTLLRRLIVIEDNTALPQLSQGATVAATTTIKSNRVATTLRVVQAVILVTLVAAAL